MSSWQSGNADWWKDGSENHATPAQASVPLEVQCYLAQQRWDVDDDGYVSLAFDDSNPIGHFEEMMEKAGFADYTLQEDGLYASLPMKWLNKAVRTPLKWDAALTEWTVDYAKEKLRQYHTPWQYQTSALTHASLVCDSQEHAIYMRWLLGKAHIDTLPVYGTAERMFTVEANKLKELNIPITRAYGPHNLKPEMVGTITQQNNHLPRR